MLNLHSEQLTAGGIQRKYVLLDQIFQNTFQSESNMLLAYDSVSQHLYFLVALTTVSVRLMDNIIDGRGLCSDAKICSCV